MFIYFYFFLWKTLYTLSINTAIAAIINTAITAPIAQIIIVNAILEIVPNKIKANSPNNIQLITYENNNGVLGFFILPKSGDCSCCTTACCT